MKWSKLKALLESRLAESLRGRLEFHVTRYRHAHDGSGRGWITLDGVEIYNASSYAADIEHERRYEELNPATRRCAAAEWHDIRDRMRLDGILAGWAFPETLASYLNLSLESALEIPDPLVRALALSDSRLGKRRLSRIEVPLESHPLVRAVYEARCEAEGIVATGRAV
jgi:hypothetical protein